MGMNAHEKPKLTHSNRMDICIELRIRIDKCHLEKDAATD